MVSSNLPKSEPFLSHIFALSSKMGQIKKLKVLVIKFKPNSLQKVMLFGIDRPRYIYRQTWTRSRIKGLKDLKVEGQKFSQWIYLSLCQPMSILLECKMWVWCSCCFRRGIKSQYFLPVVNCDEIFLTNIFLFLLKKIRHLEIEIKKSWTHYWPKFKKILCHEFFKKNKQLSRSAQFYESRISFSQFKVLQSGFLFFLI